MFRLDRQPNQTLQLKMNQSGQNRIRPRFPLQSFRIFVVATLGLFVQTVSGEIAVPSDGSDGDLITGADDAELVIDLSLSETGDWDSPSPNAGLGVYDPEKWAVVFKYRSVDIHENTTVRFVNHPANPPVVWLVQNDVNIDGTVELVSSYDTASGFHYPGPGGFRGSYRNALRIEGFGGYGPGGGDLNGLGRISAVDPQLLPLVGGSGAGHRRTGSGWNGGAGGGAILVACQTTVTVQGLIDARSPKESPTQNYYQGAGGSIRIVADAILGSGSLDTSAPEPGRIRLEANSYSGDLTTYPFMADVPPDNPPLIWPDEQAPTVRVLSVDGEAVPDDLLADLRPAKADMTLNTLEPLQIRVETRNVPVDWHVRLRIVPAGPIDPIVFEQMPLESGDESLAIWAVETALPQMPVVLQARAFKP